MLAAPLPEHPLPHLPSLMGRGGDSRGMGVRPSSSVVFKDVQCGLSEFSLFWGQNKGPGAKNGAKA